MPKENTLVVTFNLTTEANVIDKVNAEGEQKKENKAGNISRTFISISPLLLTIILAVILLVTCRRKYKSKHRLGTISGWLF